MKKALKNNKGFTLIELMIVIAIIGILAAIAIPNFMSYRNKSYCSAIQSDAKSVAAEVASYFSDPNNYSVSTTSLEAVLPQENLSYDNTYTAESGTDDVVTIKVTDGSGRCEEGDADPATYIHFVGGNQQAYWD